MQEKQVDDIHDLNTWFGYCSYQLTDLPVFKLTDVLRQTGIKSAAVKSSSITSAYWNILEGVDVSIENSTIDSSLRILIH